MRPRRAVWDLGVGVADTALDGPAFAVQRRRDPEDGYLEALPAAGDAVAAYLDAFVALRCLEIMFWPVSAWSAERAREDALTARENIRDCTALLAAL